ncbi:hypothetical protein, partial [Klebsiella pneumoniae]|uniref:hypothetical protein n=1 Tax=Klebsiella pneumoniae TaxID=573 RepID=UPI003852A477
DGGMSDRPSPSVQDRRPAVGKPANDRTVWIFAAAALIGGGILFVALENHRAGLTAPAIAPGPDDAGPVLARLPTLPYHNR